MGSFRILGKLFVLIARKIIFFFHVKDEISQNAIDFEQLKHKLTQKDAYIQTQTKKIQRLQTITDRYSSDLEANKKSNQVNIPLINEKRSDSSLKI